MKWSAIIKVLYNNYLQSKRFTSEKDLDESSESLRMDEMALLFTLHTHFALCNLDIEDIEDRVRIYKHFKIRALKFVSNTMRSG